MVSVMVIIAEMQMHCNSLASELHQILFQKDSVVASYFENIQYMMSCSQKKNCSLEKAVLSRLVVEQFFQGRNKIFRKICSGYQNFQ